MGEWVLHLRNLDSRLRENDKGNATDFSRLNEVQLFFPDPWHKKRHHKRRIVNDAFIHLIAQKLKPEGLFHLATDWQPYAESMMTILTPSPLFKNLAGTDQFSPRGDRPLSKFENRGMKLGHQIFDLRFLKVIERD